MKHIKLTVLLIMMCLISTSLFAVMLTYEQATGKLRGFQLGVADSPSIPSSYAVSTEYWGNEGYIGRIVYQGNPTTFTFSNIGPTANTTGTRFYFTYNSNGWINTSRWQEFFLVVRAKGLKQGGGQYDFSGVNAVIANNNGIFTLTQGAGTDLVLIGETGYDSNLQSGVYNGTNGYKYKYPYSYIWLDVTLIRTQNFQSLSKGYYESLFSITTGNGLSSQLNLGGEYSPRSNQSGPFAYFFGIEETAAKPFSFASLSTRNTVANALPVAKLRFSSDMSNAEVTISSDPSGMQSSFYFSSNGISFPFHVVFDSAIPSIGRSEITSSLNNTFSGTSATVASPVDGSTYSAFRLEGDICLFVDPNLTPASGIYTSTIYVSITQTN